MSMPTEHSSLLHPHLVDGFLLVDPHGRLELLNPSAERLLGLSAPLAPGAPLPEPLDTLARRTLSSATPLHDSLPGFDVDARPLSGSGVLLTLRPTPTPLAAPTQDTSLQSSAEQALHETADNFRAFFEAMTDIIVVAAPDGRILYANPSLERLLGYSPAEQQSLHLLDLHPAPLRHEAESIFAAMIRGERDTCPLPLARRNGALLPVETRVWRGRWNGAECVYGICKDLRAEQEALQRFEKLFRHNPVPMALSSLPELGFLDINDAWLQTLGYQRHQVIGQTSFDLGLFVCPDQHRLAVQRLAAEGRLENTELQIRAANGEVLDGLFSGDTVSIQGQTFFLTVMIDITARKRAEAARLRLEEELATARKLESIGRLAGGVAHDFNNLLTVINGFSSLALEYAPAGSRLRSNLEQILRAGDAAAGLTRQLLAYSRKQVLQPRVFDLNDTIRNAALMLRPLVGDLSELRLDLSPSSCPVHADPHQIEQVLFNLVLNARDAMPAGGLVRISTSLAPPAPSTPHPVAAARHVLLTVTDTGIGMDPHTLERIFEPFYTTKPTGLGTGLGLSTVHGIVSQSGGHVEVVSSPSNGTTFRVFLPSPDPAPAPAAAPPTACASSAPATILIVEDNLDVLDFIVQTLAASGYRTLRATSPDHAIALCHSESGPIHLLLSDVMLPRLPGPQLAARLAELRPGLRTLFISAYAPSTLTPDENLLSKPFTPAALLARVRQSLE